MIDIIEKHFGTNPNNPDTDRDGLQDRSEIHVYQTDPTTSDTDTDGVLDGKEVFMRIAPSNPDSDGDFWNDGIDPSPTSIWFPNWILIASAFIGLSFVYGAFINRRSSRESVDVAQDQPLSPKLEPQKEPEISGDPVLENLQKEIQELKEKMRQLDWSYAVGKIDRETYDRELQEILRAETLLEKKRKRLTKQ